MRRWSLPLAMTVLLSSGLLGHLVLRRPVDRALMGCFVGGGATLTWDLKVGVKHILTMTMVKIDSLSLSKKMGLGKFVVVV